ncbi:TetR/AcrR family transcriptional regulator [Levilactobacillus humaensis]|uniref:TetR/AcrR family transcriptional regulator n=1 Tax=Levilactobacillus humaensis TaxID=2950375 RepID=UPI0021C48134|nr:TetR/AcrR family transcriptional regulator [Levilactobacillus humaensis]
MSKDTRETIIETAIELFNKKGYDAVSLRDIAKEAGTTIGNLTYHFHHKADLLATIEHQIELDFVEFADNSSKTGEAALNELVKIFKKSAELKHRNEFFFKDFDAIVSDNPTLRVSTQLFRKRLYEAYQQCFTRMVKFEVFRQDITTPQYDHLIMVLLTMDYAWELRHGPKNTFDFPADSAQMNLSLIYPYLTENGRRIYKRIVQN